MRREDFINIDENFGKNDFEEYVKYIIESHIKEGGYIIDEFNILVIDERTIDNKPKKLAISLVMEIPENKVDEK